MSKRVSIDQAIDMIHDGDGIAISGFQSCTVSRELYLASAWASMPNNSTAWSQWLPARWTPCPTPVPI